MAPSGGHGAAGWRHCYVWGGFNLLWCPMCELISEETEEEGETRTALLWLWTVRGDCPRHAHAVDLERCPPHLPSKEQLEMPWERTRRASLRPTHLDRGTGTPSPACVSFENPFSPFIVSITSCGPGVPRPALCRAFPTDAHSSPLRQGPRGAPGAG